jgi:transcriptional regulator with XRE-family HTH domain
MKLGMNLKRLRKSSGLTQLEVAKRLGITQSAYAHYENGIRKMEAESIPKVAEILGVSILEIYGVDATNGKAAKAVVNANPRSHGNSRDAKAKQLFGKLSPSEQKTILRQIEILTGAKS